jgi:4-hydroxy-tetrahydrodipicolinate synthase
VPRAAHLAPGLWGVLATPFAGRHGAVDFPSLQRQIELHDRAGSVGLVALGVFGEARKLDIDEQEDLVRFVSEQDKRPRLIIGLSALDTAGAIDSGNRLAATVTAEPLLMVQINDQHPDRVAEHLNAIAAKTGLGIVLQDYPVASGVQVTSADVIEIVGNSDAVVAVKSEAPPTSEAISDIAAATDIPVFGGLGGIGLLDELAAGSAGAMTGFSFPEILSRVVSAWQSGGYEAARTEYIEWLPLVNFEAQPGIGIAIRKASLQLRGILDNEAVREPGPVMTDALWSMLRQHHRFLPALEVAG